MILSQHLRNTSPWLSDFGRLFDSAFARVETGPGRFRVHEGDDAWTVELELPGVAREALELEVKDDAVHLAVRRAEDDVRRFRLPLGRGIDRDSIQAKLDLGVLQLRLPKLEAKRETHKIEIQ